MWKVQQKWARLMRVLIREGEDVWTSSHIYLAVVQLVLLYGSEIWVMTPCIRMVLGRFRHRVAHRLTGRQPWKRRYRVWIYPPLEDVMAEARLQEVEIYVSRLQNTAAQFIATRPIMELCLAAERRPEPRISKQLWEQDRVGVKGVQKVYWEEKQSEGEEKMDGTETETD